MLQQQLARVRERISQAARRCGRDPAAISLIGVTKHVPAGRVADALALGLTDLGENRVQEAAAKQAALGAAGKRARWHLIGHLQRNKAREAVSLFDVIHSIDSHALIDALERYAAAAHRTVDVLIQVNVSGETTKFGCRPEDTELLALAVKRCAHVRFAGLMTIPPMVKNPEASRSYFQRLRQLRDQLASSIQHPASSVKLSMGMSSDFEVAIEEGADWVRIGTAIFGARA